MADYAFRKVGQTDEALVKHWLAQPHIGGWWQDGATEWGMIAADLANPAIDMRIVTTDGTDMGFIQDYDVHNWPAPQFDDLQAGARAVDTFLGDPAFLGQGHGTGYVAARLADLQRAHTTIVTDPATTNTRAIAAYTRAGFLPHRVTPCDDGTFVHVLKSTTCL